MKRLDLNRLSGKFSKLVKAYMLKKGLTQTEIAKMVGMQRTHLNALLNQSGERPLTGYYIQRFILRGVFKVDDIYDGKATDEKELEFWRIARVVEDRALIMKIAALKKQGIDVEAVLDAMNPKKKSNP